MNLSQTLVYFVVFLMPGYIVAWIVRRGRPHTHARTQLQFVLATLLSSLVVQLAFLPWTARLARMVQAGTSWTNHVGEIAGYLFALLGAAVVLGLVLRGLHRAVSPATLAGQSKWARAIGALHLTGLARILVDHDPPTAWDELVLGLARQGGWVLVKPTGGAPMIGKFGALSRASFSPTETPDILFEELWWADDFGQPLQAVRPTRQLWVSSGQIDFLHVIEHGENESPS